jgi:hypothetical protein
MAKLNDFGKFKAFGLLNERAVLKTRVLQTLRDCRAFPNRAKRLECGAFTAAFRMTE